MSTPALIMWAVVFAVGVPSAWRNPTAAALVLAKIAGWAIYKITGDNLPVEYYLFPDIFVIAVIMAKYERSVPDRIVLLIFPIMWCLYLAPLHPYYVWWSLWALVIVQFLAAGLDTFLISWRSRSMSGGESKQGSGPFTNRDSFVETLVPAQVLGLATVPDISAPALILAVPRYAGFPGFVPTIPLGVPHIFAVAYVAKIRDAVINLFAINVVDPIQGPAPVIHRPRNAMYEHHVPIYSNLVVACFGARCASFLSRVSRSPSAIQSIASEHVAPAGKPKQFASLRLIAEKLTKRFRGRYFSDSHCAVPSREGQGRAMLQASFRPEFSSMNRPILQRRGADAVRKTPDFSGALLTVDGGGGSG